MELKTLQIDDKCTDKKKANEVRINIVILNHLSTTYKVGRQLSYFCLSSQRQLTLRGLLFLSFCTDTTDSLWWVHMQQMSYMQIAYIPKTIKMGPIPSLLGILGLDLRLFEHPMIPERGTMVKRWRAMWDYKSRSSVSVIYVETVLINQMLLLT